MTRTFSILLLIAVLALFLGGGAWWFSSGESAPPSAAAPPGPAPASRAAQASGPTPLASAPPTPGDEAARARAEIAPPPPPPEPQGLEDGARAAPVGVDYGAKYSGHDERSLREQLTQLESVFQRDLDRELLPRFAEGGFVEHSVARDDRRSVMEVLAEHTKGDPLCRAWPVFDPAGASNATAQQSLIAVRVVCLDRDQHAALARLSDECIWLRGRLGR